MVISKDYAIHLEISDLRELELGKVYKHVTVCFFHDKTEADLITENLLVRRKKEPSSSITLRSASECQSQLDQRNGDHKKKANKVLGRRTITFPYAIRSECQGESMLMLTDENGKTVPNMIFIDDGGRTGVDPRKAASITDRLVCYKPSYDGGFISASFAALSCRLCYFIHHGMEIEALL